MNRYVKIAIFVACGLAVGQWISSKYLAPIEKRVEAMADAVEKAGLDEQPVDIEAVCGKYADNMSAEELEKLNTCYQAEAQKGLDKLNKVLKAGKLPTLGDKDPCGPDMFQMVGDDGVGAKFISLLFEKKIAEAHALLSADMRGKIPESDLIAYIDNTFWRGKTVAGATSFGSLSVSGGFTCDGKTVIPVTSYELTLNDEVAVKASMEAVQESGAWKIRAIKRVEGSATQDPNQAPLPEARQLSELVNGVMHSFVVDTSAGKIDLLYSGTSMYLRGETSRKALETKFAPFFGKYDFKAVENKPAVITSAPKAAVMDRGWPVFEVKGTQPSTNGPINFTMKFAYDGRWSLADLAVSPGS